MRFATMVAVAFIVLSTPSTLCETPPGTTYYVFEELVNIRSKPSTDSAIVGRAPVGTPVVVLENTGIAQELYGFSANWLRVRVRDVEGYLWGGLVCNQAASGDVDGDGRQELVLDRETSTSPSWRSPPKHEVKLCREGTMLNGDLIGDSIEGDEFWSLDVFFDPGFKPTVALVVISKGFNDGGIFDVWFSCFRISRQWRLEPVVFFQSVGDLGYSLEEKLLLPGDLKVTNMLVVETTARKQVGERTVAAVTKRRRFVWDGGAFTLRSEETFDVDLEGMAAGGTGG